MLAEVHSLTRSKLSEERISMIWLFFRCALLGLLDLFRWKLESSWRLLQVNLVLIEANDLISLWLDATLLFWLLSIGRLRLVRPR